MYLKKRYSKNNKQWELDIENRYNINAELFNWKTTKYIFTGINNEYEIIQS